MKLIMHTDGGARGNPGPAGVGIVFYVMKDGKRSRVADFKKYLGEATNNFAEYSALLTGLERAVEMGYDEVECFLDSELVVKQMRGEYKIKEPSLQPLAGKVLALSNKFKLVTFTHVPREKNADADKLVNQAIDEVLGKPQT